MPPVDPTQDAEFMKAQPHEQMAYLTQTDPEFAKADPRDQLGYLMHIRGIDSPLSGPAKPSMNMQQVPVAGMTPDQDNEAAMRSIHSVINMAKAAGEAGPQMAAAGPTLLHRMAQGIGLAPAGDVVKGEATTHDIVQRDLPNIAVGLATGMEGEGASKPGIKPAPEVVPGTPGVSVGSILARHIPVVGRVLRTIDDVQALLGKDAPHETATTNMAPAKTPVPETNGIQWGTGGQAPLDLRGKMIPGAAPPAEVQSIPVQRVQAGVKPTKASMIDPYRDQSLPPMTKAQSSTVEAYSYDPATQTQIIHFKSGDIYRMKGVPPEIHDQFVKDPSMGSFHAENIKGRYETTKIGKVAPTRTRGAQVSQALGSQSAPAQSPLYGPESNAAFNRMNPPEDVPESWGLDLSGKPEATGPDVGAQVRSKMPPLPRGGKK